MDITTNIAKKQLHTETIKSLLIQGESLVDSIVIKLPLEYGDVSLADLEFSISMTNEETEVTVTSVLTKTVTTEGVDVAWPITAAFTAVAGEFKPTLSCVDSSGDVILKLYGESIYVRKDPSAQGFGAISAALYEQLLAQINYAIAHMQVIRILGTYDTLFSLEMNVENPNIGDMYNVGSAAPYTVYVWQGEWVSLGALQGIQGPPGNDGQDGTNGTNGTNGADGVGIPVGGALNTYLRKKSAADYDTEFGGILPSHVGSYGVPSFDANSRVEASVGNIAINTQAGDYTFALTDYGKDVQGTNATAQTFTIPANATVAFPVGAYIYVTRKGAGTLTIAAAVGVTLQAPGNRLKIAEQYVTICIVQDSANVFRIIGEMSA